MGNDILFLPLDAVYGLRAAFWGTTSFFCLWMLFTAYAQLTLPVVRQVFVHLGFPDYFRIELSVAKILGVLVLLAPVPVRLKEWAYAGFAITLSSALVAHLSVGDGPAKFMWCIVAGAFLGLSYLFYGKIAVGDAKLTGLSGELDARQHA